MVLQEDHFSETKPSTVTRIFAHPKGFSRLFEPRPAAAILGKLSVTPFALSAVSFGFEVRLSSGGNGGGILADRFPVPQCAGKVRFGLSDGTYHPQHHLLIHPRRLDWIVHRHYYTLTLHRATVGAASATSALSP